MLDSNRATSAYIVVLSNPTPNSESILPLGQSGFIAPDGTLDPHFKDQLERYRNFAYKLTMTSGQLKIATGVFVRVVVNR